MEIRFPALCCALLLITALAGTTVAQTPAPDETPTVLKMTARRVVLDVVVTDAQGRPVRGLTQGDFSVAEDGKAQKIVTFDAVGFSAGMDYVPPTLPAQAANTFIDLPATPEKGPLYVLLLDLVNMDTPEEMNTPMDHSSQLFARKQLVMFIESKPEGTRFAVFVRSDGLHLVQGFTADKELLYRVLDPHHPEAHIPAVFLNGENFGRGDRISALNTLHSVATYLNGLPGRKNLIWYSSQFPVSLFASELDGLQFREETKATLDLLAQDQIALYPVDARGVPSGDSHAQLTTSVHSDTITSPMEAGSGTASGSGGGAGSVGTGAVGNSPSTTSSFVDGSSTVMGGYNTMDGIARETGGAAFYGTNDVSIELVKATESGERYYTLSYAPTNQEYEGKLRNIDVELKRNKGYALTYRRSYYGAETEEPTVGATAETSAAPALPGSAQRAVGDSLSADMQHGAPAEHDLVFVVQAREVGDAAMGTPEEMAEMATEPAYFTSRRKSAAAKPLVPVLLQRDVFEFEIPTRQFHGEAMLNLELAAAAYDADGRMMNAFVRVARKDLAEKPRVDGSPLFFRVEQELEVPVGATSIRFGVRDDTNNRMGAMEIKLPLAQASAKP